MERKHLLGCDGLGVELVMKNWAPTPMGSCHAVSRCALAYRTLPVNRKAPVSLESTEFTVSSIDHVAPKLPSCWQHTHTH